MRIYVGNKDSTHICAYLRKSGYVCYLPYLPSPIPTSQPQRPPTHPPETSPPALGLGGGGDGGGDGAWEVGEVADVARLT